MSKKLEKREKKRKLCATIEIEVSSPLSFFSFFWRNFGSRRKRKILRGKEEKRKEERGRKESYLG